MTNTNTQTKPVAVITGMAPGLGESVANTFSEAGYKIAGIARSDTMARQMASNNAYAHFECDLAEGQKVRSVFDRIEREIGEISVVVCNAHQLLIRSFGETGLDEIESVWRNGCFSAITACHAAVPKMVQRGQGTIILTGATAGLRGGGKFAAFASAKFALRGFAQALAREYAPQGIHVVHIVLDGLIWEDQTRERFNPSEEKCMSPDAIAKAYLQMAQQEPSVWTHELDMRPFCETF